MRFLDSIPFERLLWLVPFFLAIHNLEEAPFMESWSKRLPLKLLLSITTRQFLIAVIFLTLAGFLLTYIALEYTEKQTGYLIILTIQAIILLNALIPHLASTLWFRLYSPGIVTALLVNIPFSFYLFHRALSEHILSWSQLWILLGIAPIGLVASALLSLQIGKAFNK
ncbi:MAG TPA: HXXEE domain-containing protein [Anaerolineales bacterium]|nr:HXXEE domain-containing protein [Anaerolineales bacterium]